MAPLGWPQKLSIVLSKAEREELERIGRSHLAPNINPAKY